MDQIKRVAVDFYKNLLGTNSLQFDDTKAGRISQLLKNRISDSHI